MNQQAQEHPVTSDKLDKTLTTDTTNNNTAALSLPLPTVSKLFTSKPESWLDILILAYVHQIHENWRT